MHLFFYGKKENDLPITQFSIKMKETKRIGEDNYGI